MLHRKTGEPLGVLLLLHRKTEVKSVLIILHRNNPPGVLIIKGTNIKILQTFSACTLYLYPKKRELCYVRRKTLSITYTLFTINNSVTVSKRSEMGLSAFPASSETILASGDLRIPTPEAMAIGTIPGINRPLN